MRTNQTACKRLLIKLCSALCLIGAAIYGCGGSSDPIQIPEEARKSLFQKKVDVEHRSTKAVGTSPSTSKSPGAGKRP